MHNYRELRSSDLLASSHAADMNPHSRLESVKTAVKEGDPYILIAFTHSLVNGGDSEATGIREIEIMLPVREAQELIKFLQPTVNYLQAMGSAFNPDPAF